MKNTSYITYGESRHQQLNVAFNELESRLRSIPTKFDDASSDYSDIIEEIRLAYNEADQLTHDLAVDSVREMSREAALKIHELLPPEDSEYNRPYESFQSKFLKVENFNDFYKAHISLRESTEDVFCYIQKIEPGTEAEAEAEAEYNKSLNEALKKSTEKLLEIHKAIVDAKKKYASTHNYGIC